MHRPPICMLAILTAAGLGGSVATSEACCNALPVIARDYQSTLGSVRERIVAPGNAVTITRKPCDALNGTTPPFFDPVTANNLVTIVFNPTAGGGGTKTTAPLSSQQCDKSGNCITCPVSSPYPCNTLTFAMPDTDADLPPADGDGWTGPATITVTTGGSTVAKIDYLYPPSDGCDCGGGAPTPQCQKEGDGVFMQFTVLPTANDFQSLVTGWPLRMTLDGGGNLLVPIHHPATAYAKAGFGEWERGAGTFCAYDPPPSDPNCRFSPKMANRLATAAPGSLQAFTISGQRVAPIFDHDGGGELFGVADVEYSVLWIRKGAGAGYDVGHRIKNGKGPIRIDKSSGSSGSQFDLTTCRLAKLVSMRLASEVVANVDDTNTVQIHERVEAGKDCGVDTGLVADNVILDLVTDVALDAQGSVVAFLKQGGPTVEAFSAKGKRLTPAQVQTATTAWRVNDNALAVEDALAGDLTADSLVYFFDPKDELRTFNRKSKKSEDVALANAAAALGQRVVTQPPTGNAQAHRYPWTTSTNHSTLSVSATELAIAPDLIAAAATGGTVKVWPWPAGSPPPNTAPLDSGVETDQPLGIANACTGSGCTRLVVNSKTMAGDHVLRIFSFDPSTGSLQDTTLKASAEDFVVGDRLVAFRTRESKGNDLNGNGYTDDVVMRLVAFDAAPPYTPHVFETGSPAIGWKDPDGPWNVLGWRTAYQAVGDDVFFVTRECDGHGTKIDTLCSIGGNDLNRDGDADDLVLQIYHQGSKTVKAVAAVGTGPVEILPLSNGVSVQVAGSAPPEGASADAAADAAPLCVAQAALVDVAPAAGVTAFPLPTPKGGIVVGDGDQDGVLDGFDNCETSPNAAQFDDDRDGLGDRFCDPTYCTNFTPPVIAPRGPLAPSAQQAAFRYFEQLGRPKASLSCLERIATGELSGDPETLCRGSFVADVENLPFDKQTAAFETRSELGFLTVLDKRGDQRMLSADQTQAFRRLVRSFGESVNAATRVAYGQVQKLPAGRERAFQINLGRESVRHLETLVAAMSDCLDEHAHRADAAARCLGRIEAGKVVLPTDPKTAKYVQSSTDALRAATDDGCDGCILAQLDTCASDTRRELDCPVCTNWRNAVEVIERVYGPPPAAPRLRLAHAARK